jgi:hypothetical protein
MRDANLPGFDFLDLAPIRLPIVVVDILFVTLIDFKLLLMQSFA